MDFAAAWLEGRLLPTGALPARVPWTQGGLLDCLIYWPALLLNKVLAAAGGFTGFQQLSHVFVIPACTTALVLVIYGWAAEIYRDRRAALFTALAAGLATMIWPYAKFGMETMQTLCFAAGGWALSRHARRGTVGSAAALGLAIGALPLTKITGIFNAGALGVAALSCLLMGRWWARPRFRTACLMALAGMAMGAMIFFISNRWRYGGWVYGGRYRPEWELLRMPLWEGLWAVLASPNKSLVLFSPALLLAAWQWRRFWKCCPELRVLLVLTILIVCWQVRARTWAEETWGPRRLHFVLPLAVLPLGLWWQRRWAMGRLVRGLGWAALACGVWVQLVAISFDYTVMAKLMGHHPVFLQMNVVWNPQLNPLRFNLHLWRSWWARQQGEPELPYVVDYFYMNYTSPPNPPPPDSFALRGLDQPDFWPLQQARDWAPRPYWFHSPTSWLALLLLIGTLATGIVLLRRLRGGPPGDVRIAECATISD